MEHQKGELIRLESINDLVAYLKTSSGTLWQSLFTSPNVMALLRDATYEELDGVFYSPRARWFVYIYLLILSQLKYYPSPFPSHIFLPHKWVKVLLAPIAV